MTLDQYTVILKPDDNGSFIAYVPAIPGCHALGHSPLEAHQELIHVFAMIQEEYEEEGKVLPQDCQINVAYAS